MRKFPYHITKASVMKTYSDGSWTPTTGNILKQAKLACNWSWTRSSSGFSSRTNARIILLYHPCYPQSCCASLSPLSSNKYSTTQIFLKLQRPNIITLAYVVWLHSSEAGNNIQLHDRTRKIGSSFKICILQVVIYAMKNKTYGVGEAQICYILGSLMLQIPNAIMFGTSSVPNE